MTKKEKPRDKIYRTTPKKLYLEQILLRLESEYIQILNMVTEYNLHNERGIGFWSLIRIIFPVIETVSSVIGKQKEDFLEEELEVPYGHLVWELYRHALMHSDELRYAIYEGKTISWAAHLGNEGEHHFVADKTDSHLTTIHIAIPCLYFTLREFLVKEIAKNDTSEISIQDGVYFSNHQGKLIKELEELCKNH
jgi:hypothetical protein